MQPFTSVRVMFLSFLVLCKWLFASSSFYGPTGLSHIPTAGVVPNGKAVIGVGRMSDYLAVTNQPRYLEKQWSCMGTIGFIPGLEISLRLALVPALKMEISRVFDFHVDRSVSIKYLIRDGSRPGPAFAIGVQDMEGSSTTVKNNCLYFVGSEYINLPAAGRILLHLGYGTKLWNRVIGKILDYRFIGIFGGAEISPFSFLTASAEYDAQDLFWNIMFKPSQPFSILLSSSSRTGLGLIGCCKFTL